jgi:hypothetical protein
MSGEKIYFLWNNDELFWNTTEYVWSDVAIVIQVASSGGGGGGLILDPNNPWKSVLDKLKEEKIEKKVSDEFLKIVAKVNGLVISEKKEINRIEKKIKIHHIKKTFETFGQKVEVKVKNIRQE